MKNIWILSKANLRKSKSQTISMLLLMLLAATFLYIGLTLFTGLGSFFEMRANELNAPHFVAFVNESDPLDAPLEFVHNFPGVVEVETQDVLQGNGSFLMGGEPLGGTIVIATETAQQTMNPPSLIGRYMPLEGNAVYIPHFLFLDGGFAIGDDFVLDFMGEERLLTVAGSTEEIMFGASMNSIWRVYVSVGVFEELQEQVPAGRSILISARMTYGDRALTSAFRAEFDEMAMNFSAARENRTMIPAIAAATMVTFALTLLLVCAIVIRFRINNDIEETMKNIGVLKAMGYRNRQIIMSIIIQFCLIALVGGIVGILFSQVLFPVVTGIFEPLLGLQWSPAFDIAMTFIVLGMGLTMVLLFSYVTARQIKKLHPLIALRGGITTHSFRKNPLPLDKTRGALSFLLAVKNILKNKKQTIMLSLIIAAVTILAAEGLLVHYNMSVNTSAFIRMFGEVPDIFAIAEDAESGAKLRERMTNHPDVTKIFSFDNATLLINETAVNVRAVENFEYLAGNELVSGRFPILDSEIALHGAILSELGKNVGDWVTIRSGDYEKEYIVTGTVQEMGNLAGMMTSYGLRYVMPDFESIVFYIYVQAEIDVDEFIEAFTASNADINVPLISAQRQFDGQMGVMGDIFAAVNVVLLTAAATVVMLVLYLIIKTTIIRRKRELGIQKALGFTTFQLMNQVALGLSPSIILGAVLGTVGAYTLFNPLMDTVMGGMGIVQSNLLTPISWVVVPSIVLVLLAYVVSMLISFRIRKISAYALVSE